MMTGSCLVNAIAESAALLVILCIPLILGSLVLRVVFQCGPLFRLLLALRDMTLQLLWAVEGFVAIVTLVRSIPLS